MAVIWPSAVPLFRVASFYSESGRRNVTRIETESGIAVTYRSSTVAPQNFRIGHNSLTATQFAAFEAFFVSDLKDGSIRFEMAHPRTGVPAEWRFIEGYEAASGGKLWTVSATVELLP